MAAGWQYACGQYGLEMTGQVLGLRGRAAAGHRAEHLRRGARRGARGDAFVDEFLTCKKTYHKSQEAKNGSPPAIDCVIALVKAYVARGVPVAIASSGLRDIVERHCAHAGVLELFGGNVVVAAEVPKGKPAPDVFLAAAKMIGADPAKCRAYEDGESGLESAYRAGMQVVDVREMEGYPMNDGLRAAMAKQRAARTWLA